MNVGVVASRLEFPRQENPESGARQQSANDDSAKAPPQRTSMQLASAWHARSACAEQFETSTSACSLHTLGSSCRSEEHTSELQSRLHLVCRLLLEKKKKQTQYD